MVCRICKDERTCSVVELRESRHSGCWLCSTLLDAVDISRPDWTSDHLDNGRISCQRFGGSMWVNLYVKDDFCHQFHLYQHQEPCEELMDDPCLSTLDIVRSTSSEAAFSRVSSWVADCVARHDGCTPPNPDFIPRRLVNVGTWNGDTEPFLFEPKQPCAYVALSYCWGVNISEVPTTTTSRLGLYGSAIQFSSLPETIRDAITFCRGIKVVYLWVDMLCIIQDSPEDWTNEASKMHFVYSNSFLTLAAHAPASCRTGFLGEQVFGQEKWQRCFRPSLRGQQNDRKPDRMYVRDGPSSRSTKSSALEQRGWTFQESILPIRILHLTGAEMAWECNTRNLCECSHILGVPDTVTRPQPFPKSLFRFGESKYFSPHDPIGKSWMVIVSEYSYRKLTKQTDKLIAISGLAQMAINSARSSTTYLAGIWQDQLPKQLLWNALNHREDTYTPQHQRPSKYIAPTWSWASINDPIYYNLYALSGEEASHIDILDCLCVPELPLNPTGALTRGHITISGFLMPVLLRTGESARGMWGCTDNWRRQATWVRVSDRQTMEISCDLPQAMTIREKMSSGAYTCWPKPCHEERCDDCYFDLTCKALYERIGVGCEINDSEDSDSDNDGLDFFATAKIATVKIV